MSELDERDARAAEFVLGTLDAGERVAVARDRLRDPTLDAAIRAWEARLGPLAEAAPEVAPPADLFDRIERRIADPAAVLPAANIATLQGRLRRWRSAATAMTALAAALAIALGLSEYARRIAPTSYVAVLQKDGAGPAFVVSVDLAAGRLTARPVAAAPQADKSYELWLVDAKLGDPRSLGVIAPEGYTVQPALAGYPSDVVAGATYAVSLEPKGGSPTGKPTGPVLFTGKLVQATP